MRAGGSDRGGSVAPVLAAFDAYADQVAPAVAGHWR